GEGDRLEREQCLASAGIELGRNGEAVADAMQLPGRLEILRELGVLGAREAAVRELGLQACGRLGAVAERRGRAGCKCLPVAALGVEEREDCRRPRLIRQQLGEPHPRTAWTPLRPRLPALPQD